MMKHILPLRAFGPLRVCALTALVGLSACGPAPSPQGINDPYEAQNRKVHGVNLVLDKNVIRPLATGASKIIPKPVSRGLSNFASNLGLPGEVANDILQLRLDRAGRNTWRFVINTTVGIGGILDPATAFGAAEKPTDFGETLHVWGLAEGNYIELPFYGPSTERDTLGKIVDLGLDPVRILIPKDKGWIVSGAKIVSRIDERGRYSDTVDSILYDSADGYAQARLFYLENRRHNLGQTTADSEFEDPYAQ